MTQTLTGRQRAVLDYLVTHIQSTGLPPTIREIGQEMGVSSTNSVFRHLRELERKGFISHNPEKARSIHVVGLQEIARLRDRLRRLPVLGRVAAGKPILAQAEETGRHLDLDETIFGPEAAFALEVQGESMIEAGIQEGDLVIVRPQQTAQDGDIVVALVGDDATVKRFRRRGSEIVLEPENSSMRPLVFAPDSGGFTIEGKVVGVIRRYR
ncbi:MAG: transcriptional repressor LexA [Candidatus Wallbacteria bacterium]|nr:transcriptional repressor LexA [Candidatus Wallbacteria bacterium]